MKDPKSAALRRQLAAWKPKPRTRYRSDLSRAVCALAFWLAVSTVGVARAGRAFFLGYTKALLAEFGPDMDAQVWNETFHVPCGKLGTDAWPGYADRALMRLVREITGLVEEYNRAHRRQIAFLTSDCLGTLGDQGKAPYALVSHGTYQDSWCQPGAWSYGIFANYRNVLWSCCWWPVTKWSWIEFGVREYQAPSPTAGAMTKASLN